MAAGVRSRARSRPAPRRRASTWSRRRIRRRSATCCAPTRSTASSSSRARRIFSRLISSRSSSRRALTRQLPIVIYGSGGGDALSRWRRRDGVFALREARSLERLMDAVYFSLHRPLGDLSDTERAGHRGVAPRQPRAGGQESADRRRRHAQHLRAVDGAARPRHADHLGQQRPRGDPPRAGGSVDRHRADGHHDAGDGRHDDDARDPQARTAQRLADHRRHRESDERRPREVHRSGRLGLSRRSPWTRSTCSAC